MEGERFDALIRTARSSAPRRTILATVFTGIVGLPSAQTTDAKRKKRKKNRNRNQPPPPPSAACAEGQKLCQGTCIPSNQCCVDADCAALAPRCCQGACIRPTECCTNSDCGAGKICQAAACICAAGAKQCGASCCLAPAGILAKVTCGDAPAPICSCGINLAEICTGGCNSEVRVLSCTDPDIREILENLCQEAGCGPPNV